MIKRANQQISPSLQRKIAGMKHFLLFVMICPVLAVSQDKKLMAEGSSPNLFITHTVQAKDNFYSIGRLYNLSPKEIAPYNKMALEKGLNPGQSLKIPLVATNFIQHQADTDDEVLIPLYYSVKEKEGLYRIGITHNKLTPDALKKLNGLTSDEVKKGSLLVVGYLKVKKNQSALVTEATNKPVHVSKVKAEEKKPVTEPMDTTGNRSADLPVVQHTEKIKRVAREEEKKDVPVQKEVDPVVPKNVNIPVIDHGGGVFKDLYNSQVSNNNLAEETGTAAIFKSTSGWNDGKYYCLHNSAAPGTIIRITNSVSGKSVYAKVLDIMPDIKLNNGLLIRLSNAAASELGSGESNFKCTINYSK